MGIRTLTFGKKLHITVKWLPMMFNVMLGNFPCLVSRLAWVKTNENLPKINCTDYITFYDYLLKVAHIIHKKFTIIISGIITATIYLV